MTTTTNREYLIISGEGDGQGHLHRVTVESIQQLEQHLDDQRCGGDRWAGAIDINSIYQCKDGFSFAGTDQNGNGSLHVDREWVDAPRVTI